MRACFAFVVSVVIALAASTPRAAAERKPGAPGRGEDGRPSPTVAEPAASPPQGGNGPSAADTSAAATPPASPEPPAVSKGPPAPFPKLKAPSLLHRYQLGLAVLPGIGYRVIAPYQENIPCGQQDKRVCTGRLPFFLDVQPSFGFAARWDVLLDLRFGIGEDFTRSHELALAPGVRYWVDPDQPYKFFATIQLVFDATAQNNPAVKDNDFGIRNANGFMFEVMRNFGIYAQLGETIGLRRWLRFEIDGGIGVQARIP